MAEKAEKANRHFLSAARISNRPVKIAQYAPERNKNGSPAGPDFLNCNAAFALSGACALLHHLPEDGKLLGRDENMGENEDEPEPLHILFVF